MIIRIIDTLLRFTAVLGWTPTPNLHPIINSEGKKIESLYPEYNSPVFVVQTEDFQPQANDIVLYYSAMCPHCWRYAPKFLHLAELFQKNGMTYRFVSVNCNDFHPICRNAHISYFPELRLYDGFTCSINSPEHKFSRGRCLCRNLSTIKTTFECLSGKLEIINPSEIEEGIVHIEPKIDDSMGVAPDSPMGIFENGWEGPANFGSPFMRSQDGIIALLKVLIHGFGTDPTLKKLNAAQEIIRFISQSYPDEGTRTSFNDLGEKFDKFTQVTRDLKQLKDVIQEWEHQWGQYEVYTMCTKDVCGLWQLFHVITAAQAVDIPGVMEASPEETLGLINLVVQQFLPCEVCRVHFQNMFDCPPRKNVQTPRDAVLWLWRAHQAVSLRVAREAEQFRVDRRWPQSATCFRCLKENDMENRKELKVHPEQDYWCRLDLPYDIEDVYQFLLVTYLGPDLIPTTTTKEPASVWNIFQQ